MIAGIIISIHSVPAFLILLIITIPELIVSSKYAGKIYKTYLDSTGDRRKVKVLDKILTNTSNWSEAKVFQNEKKITGMIKKLSFKYTNDDMQIRSKEIKYKAIASTVSQIAIILTLLYFAQQTLLGNISLGTFIFLFGSIIAIKTALSVVFENIAHNIEIDLYMSKIFTFLEIKPLITNPKKAIKIKESAPKIVFENISFKYPDTNRYILKKFSLSINAGEKIAIMGENGAGKTTLTRLLCRFYDPTEGRILINGVDLRELDLNTWRKTMGVLFQDFSNYDFFNISELIHLGKSNKAFNKKKAIEAAKKAQAHKMISYLNKEYKTIVGKSFGGVELSGGQKQKLALSKVHYRSPHMVILDEPTSAMDMESERKVFSQIHKLPKSITAIFISHRINTVLEADKICYIKSGTVLEYGTHGELMKNNKDYAKLFNAQQERMKKGE